MDILIALKDESERRLLKTVLSDEDSHRVTSNRVVTFEDGREVYNYLCNNKVDALIVDLVLKGIDGITLAEIAKEEGWQTKIVVLSGTSEDSIVQKAFTAGVDYFAARPYNINSIKRIVLGLNKKAAPLDSDVEEIIRNKQIERRISKLLMNLGIRTNLKGYKFLLKSILYGYNDFEMVDCVTKILYPQLAKEYQSTSEKVERSIRHAIKIAWDSSGDRQVYKRIGLIISDDSKRPTNSQFITTAIEYLKNTSVINRSEDEFS